MNFMQEIQSETIQKFKYDLQYRNYLNQLKQNSWISSFQIQLKEYFGVKCITTVKQI